MGVVGHFFFLLESAAHKVAVFRRCEPSRVAREIIVVSIGSDWLLSLG